MATERVWIRTGIPPKCKLTKWRKEALKALADEWVRDFYKPVSIGPPPKDQRFNYIVDFSAKWQGQYLQFIAHYTCPGPNAMSPFFDMAFARHGYFHDDACSLWARRHNDQGMVLGHQMTLPECFAAMRATPSFQF